MFGLCRYNKFPEPTAFYGCMCGAAAQQDFPADVDAAEWRRSQILLNIAHAAHCVL